MEVLWAAYLAIEHEASRIVVPAWMVFAGGAQMAVGVAGIGLSGPAWPAVAPFAIPVIGSGAVMAYEGFYYLFKGRFDNHPYEWPAGKVRAIVPK